jgi:hypothetical protein
MPLQATSGAASYDAFGGGVPAVPNYIEEVFSTFLYTGNDSTQTITNGIDLSTKGGMVWVKSRSQAGNPTIIDTVRGVNKNLPTNQNYAQDSDPSVSSFNSDGFSINSLYSFINDTGTTYASWTFRKQPKFFDVVTYTGNGVSGRAISHNLGSTPGFIVVKCTSSAAQWICWHRAYNSGNGYGYLNDTTAWFNTGADVWGNGTTYTAPTSTTFTVNGDTVGNLTNGTGDTYVAYVFAHNAGGFGLTGTDNVISCGSYTGNGSTSGPVVNLGYEPQWLLIKEATQSGNAWSLFDNMRGLSVSGPSGHLRPNASDAEDTTSVDVRPTATGFQPISSSGRVNRSGETFIYIAIRRGPMKVPTSGTSVFAPVLNTGTSTNTFYSSGGFAPDMLWNKIRTLAYGTEVWDKLRGVTQILTTSNTSAETNGLAGYDLISFNNTGVTEGNNSSSVMNVSPYTYVNYMFGRAPSFFDEVCYSGNSVAGRTLTHNLGVVPQLIIVKARTIDVGWAVYAEPAGNTKYSELNDTVRFTTGINCWNNTSPTSSVFSLSSNAQVNRTGDTYVAYLFSTCAGVSKVGSYTGTGSLQTINCGFTSGARFVLIKNQDVNGSWYVWDSARGITSGNDPYLLLNSTAAEVTNTNYVDTDSTGFKVTGNTAVNTSGDTYIFLAIA